MIYGKEYGAGSSDCRRCEAHSANLHHETCYECGEHGCDRCMVECDFGTDRETGYHDIEYLCESCQGRLESLEDAAWEQKGDLMRDEGTGRFA